MISRLFAFVLAVSLLASPAFAQDEGPVPPKQPNTVSVTAASSVTGLELPADQTVNYDEGFLNLQAKCKGEVKWLVVSGVKVKYVTVPQTNSIIISVPPQGGIVINVFAVGLVDSKLTDFARTNVTVVSNAPVPPNPGPGPGPEPGPVTGKLHITFLIDMSNPTPELAKLVNSESLRKGINQKGYWFRLYDVKSPIIAQKHLDQVVQRVGGNNVMIIQAENGRVVDARVVPTNENDIFSIISQVTGR